MGSKVLSKKKLFQPKIKIMASSIIMVTHKKCNKYYETLYSTEYSTKANGDDQKDMNSKYKINDYYDEALSKNDPKRIAPIRRWEKRMGFITPIRWINSFFITLLHALFLYSLYILYIRGGGTWNTVICTFFFGGLGGFGVTGGAHRFWTHRSYKAKLPLQIVLMLAFSTSGQNTIPEWVRDHRVHHKMSETTADPHDANRGFFFSHIGWLMMKKHPHVIREGKKIDMSDILNDPLVQFHTKYFVLFKIIFLFLIPTAIPALFWGEFWDICLIATILRFTINLHCTWSVNSFAHLWGNKPYDVNIMPVENWKVSIFAMGEGWHNYHHTFPWDYKAAELAYFVNVSTFYIDCFARIGWAYDLKKASPSLIQAIVNKKGPKVLNHKN